MQIDLAMSGCALNLRDLDSHPAQVFCKDLDGRYLYVNPSVEKAYQCSAEQFVGLTAEESPFQIFATTYEYSDDLALTRGYIECIEPMIIGGEIVSGLAKKTRLMDKAQKPMGVLGFLEPLQGDQWQKGDYQHPASVPMDKFIAKAYFQGLTVRESEVLYLVVRGYSASAIAKELSLSVYTVQEYIESMKNRLAIDNKQQLIQKAFDMGFVFFTPERFRE